MDQINVKQFQAKYCLSYLLTSNGECVLIDPHITLVDEYKKAVKSTGRVKAIIDTHTHADHVSSAAICSRLFDAPIVMSENAISQQEIQRVTTGDKIEFGGTQIEFYAAPGHTDDSVAVLCEGNLFTGDVLLIGSVGRCDFQNGSPESMFETLSMFKKAFPPETVIYPAHDYQGKTQSTLGEEIKSNPFMVETNKQAFITTATTKKLPKPADMDRIIEVNRAGTAGEVHRISAEEANGYLQDESKWKVIDVRAYEEYQSSHIDPSMFVPLESIGQRARELSTMPENLIFVCNTDNRASMAASAISMTGASNAYVLKGGMTAWQKAKLPVKQVGPAFTLQRQVQTIAATMVIIGAVLTLTVNLWWVLLCLWVGLGLLLAGTTGKCPMAMILLKMPWNKIEIESEEEGGGCAMDNSSDISGGYSTGGGGGGCSSDSTKSHSCCA